MTATVTPFPHRAPSLHDGLLAALRDLIELGELMPGVRVPERSLCERFGVSRTPLRECLKVLAAEGLVELLPNRGARVATLEDEHLVHLFEVIGALESEAGRLACGADERAGFGRDQSVALPHGGALFAGGAAGVFCAEPGDPCGNPGGERESGAGGDL